MQATCPQCSQVIAVDDSKVPAGPFMLRCPRCQNTMKMAGNGAETSMAESQPAQQERTASPPASPPPQETTHTPPPVKELPPALPQEAAAASPPPKDESPPAPAPKDASPGESPMAHVPQAPAQQASTPPPAPTPQQQPANGNATTAASSNGQRALIELPEAEHATSVIQVLQQQGYAVDTMDRWDERAIELQQGVYDLVVTHRNGLPSSPKNGLFRLVSGLPPELRSRLFLVLVGDDYKTGNTTEAFAAMADFVCHPQDVPAADGLLRTTVAEKGRLYRAYLDILRRKEAGEL